MTCREIADFLMQYLDGELPRRQRATFELHLANCPACRVYVESYERTVTLARSSKSAADVSITESMPDELVRLILESRSRNS
ncbi:MAG: zf-HC2 domain-containing protein [Planctomycetes bacterium]|nr:zf-HC2 domain-containing protein [Planctomycetota bacterium]